MIESCHTRRCCSWARWACCESVLWLPRPSQREFAPGTLGPKEGKATGGKLFHREERPTLERNIIDTSTSDVSNRLICENWRHFLGPLYTGGPGELAEFFWQIECFCI